MLRWFTRNPYIFFLPFLLVYGLVIFFNRQSTLIGDEIRYVNFAFHLLHGFYSPPAPYVNLWNGPGYPLIIVPFITLHLHTIYIALFNGLFQYLAVVFVYKAARLVANKNVALGCGLVWAVYPNIFPLLPLLYTESFTIFLVAALVYTVALAHFRASIRYLMLAGLILGFLTLTKIIFGYVLLLGLVCCAVLWLRRSSRRNAIKLACMLAVALVVTLPYLVYTYHITGKVFYWGDSGGMSLYWMSTPYEHEYGDWKVPQLTNTQYPYLFKSVETRAILQHNHADQIGAILRERDYVKQDELFKQAAMHNIGRHPFKFIKNYYYNVSRMLFNFPYSYAYQDANVVTNIFVGSLVLWGSVIGLVLSWVNRKRIIYPIKILLLLAGLYLMLSGALSAYPRQLDVMIPVFIFWAAFLLANMQPVKLRFKDDKVLEEISLPDLSDINVQASPASDNTLA